MSAKQLNEILKQVENLSSEEKRFLANELLKQVQQQPISISDSSLQQEKEAKSLRQNLQMKWLAEHRTEFAGQWVALEGDHLISHGSNSREVIKAARKQGIKVPFIAYLEPCDALPFGGW